MESHLVEWLNLAVRWFHFTTGIAWIGASFYFNWLENHLNRVGQRDEIAGSLWAVHGGGFYYLEKYKVAPHIIPKPLHWFKYESYFTWISGISLLAIVYYWNPQLYLIDSSKLVLSSETAIGLSLAILFGSWFFYDALCKSKVGTDNRIIAAIGLVVVAVLSYGLSLVFSDRAAYIHVGAALGTCMVANVFRVIIPSQRALVDAGLAGRRPDPILGKKAFQRSLHNNYMTLPVLFVMISNHFPSTFGHALSWQILILVSLVGFLIRHWFNLKGRGQYQNSLLIFAAIGFIGAGYLTRPQSKPAQEVHGIAQISDERMMEIINARCVSCHSSAPTDDVFTVAPAGVMYESIDDVRKFKERIKARAVDTNDMPFANKTMMTENERHEMARWIAQP